MTDFLNKNFINEAEVDRSNFKIGFLALLGIIFSFLFGYFINDFIIGGQSLYFYFGFACGIIFGAIFLLKAFFMKSSDKIFLIVFLESLALFFGFFRQLSPVIGIAVFIAFLILISGIFGGKRELQNFLKIRFWKIGKVVLPKVILAITLVSSAAYFNNFYKNISLAEVQILSKEAFERIIAPTDFMVKKFYPGFDFSLKAEDWIINMAKSQIEDSSAASVFPASAKSQLVKQASDQLKKSITDFSGAPVNFGSKISEAIYDVVILKIKQMAPKTKIVFMASVSALIFLTVMGFILPIRWIMAALAFIIYEIFLAVGFATVAMEGRNREIIILK